MTGVQTCALPISPQLDHPANPYSHHPSQPPPAYNVYTPGPSRSRASVGGAGGGFHRQDPLRRSSSGGQYRQAYDVMPSGDQVLKFYRSTDFTQGDVPAPSPNPYPPRQQYPEPPYPSRSSYPFAPQPITSPSAALAGLSLGGPRAFPPQYPFQPGPVLGQYPNAPHRDLTPDSSQRPPGLHNQRGLARQGSLPGPNWTIHTEGQTRSYC